MMVAYVTLLMDILIKVELAPTLEEEEEEVDVLALLLVNGIIREHVPIVMSVVTIVLVQLTLIVTAAILLEVIGLMDQIVTHVLPVVC